MAGELTKQLFSGDKELGLKNFDKLKMLLVANIESSFKIEEDSVGNGKVI